MTRRSERPDTKGCTGPRRGILTYRRHNWQYSTAWNGSAAVPLAAALFKRSFARSGWRCFNCGVFRWDATDREYALSIYDALGLVTVALPADKALDVLAEDAKPLSLPPGAISKAPAIMTKLPGDQP